MRHRSGTITAAFLTACTSAALFGAASAGTAATGPTAGPAVGAGARAWQRSLCAPPADTVGPTAGQVGFGRSSIDLVGNRAYAVPELTLVSGTPQSGVWRGSFTVSEYARPGTYSIIDPEMFDAAGQTDQVWANQDQVVPQLSDGNRNPLDWNYEASEVLDS